MSKGKPIGKIRKASSDMFSAHSGTTLSGRGHGRIGREGQTNRAARRAAKSDQRKGNK